MKKQTQPLNLFIACKNNGHDAALRIYDGDEVIYYNSTRIGGVARAAGGYLVKDVDKFLGQRYELKLPGSNEVFKGIIGDDKLKNTDE